MSAPTAHPLWSQFASATADVALLTATSIQYAREFAAAAIGQRIREEDQQEHEVLQFVEVADDSAVDENADDDDSVGLDASFSTHLNSAATRLFCT